MKYYSVTTPLKDSSYCTLLGWALEVCSKFSLIWRHSLSYNKRAKGIESKLTPFLISEGLANEWPGTKVYGPPEDIIRFYTVTPETVDILKTAKNIYAWLSPNYPEDLAFYKADGSPWFGSVAHEEMSFFFDLQLSEEEIKSRIPNINVEFQDIEDQPEVHG